MLGQHPFFTDAPFDGRCPAYLILGSGSCHRAFLRKVCEGSVSMAETIEKAVHNGGGSVVRCERSFQFHQSVIAGLFGASGGAGSYVSGCLFRGETEAAVRCLTVSPAF